MPYINLIEEKRIVERRRENQSRLGVYSLLAIGGLSVLAYGTLMVQHAVLSGRELKIEAEMAKLQPALGQIDEDKRAEARLTPRLTSLEDAQKMTDRWRRVLDHFSVQTPTGVWLTAMRSSGSDANQPIAVSLTGVASNQDQVGEFMLRTQNQKDLDKVALKFTQEKSSPAGVNYEFELDAEVKGTSVPKPEEKK